jgi:hypothetical protein
MPVIEVTDDGCRWWCPGCDCMHIVPVEGEHVRGFIRYFEHPTLTPSVLIYSQKAFVDTTLEGAALIAPTNVYKTPQCHAFFRDGRIEYLGDCTHYLGGQPVPMMSINEQLANSPPRHAPIDRYWPAPITEDPTLEEDQTASHHPR